MVCLAAAAGGARACGSPGRAERGVERGLFARVMLARVMLGLVGLALEGLQGLDLGSKISAAESVECGARQLNLKGTMFWTRKARLPAACARLLPRPRAPCVLLA